jgi:hypothetical protein
VIKELNSRFKNQRKPSWDQKYLTVLHLKLNYTEKHGSEGLSKNNRECDFSASDDDFLGFFDE